VNAGDGTPILFHNFFILRVESSNAHDQVLNLNKRGKKTLCQRSSGKKQKGLQCREDTELERVTERKKQIVGRNRKCETTPWSPLEVFTVSS
jgi:hypothetical protein